MSIRRAALLCLGAVAVLAAAPAAAQEAPSPERAGALRVFIDCDFGCDETFLRQEITIVNYVRDRKEADVHVLVTPQPTGGGGIEFTVKFIGLGRFAGVDQTLSFATPQATTADERRNALAEVLKRGLVRYVAETPLAPRMKITFSAPETKAAASQVRDRWNLWVFRANFGGSFNGERSNRGRSLRGGASANRTTEAWKITFSTNGSYRENTFQLSETETFTSISRNMDASGLVVKSLTQHWSVGLMGNASRSTFLNYDLRARIAPGVEYNFFPYSQSTRRMFTVQYTVGANSFDYEQVTIFGKNSEKLMDHRLEVGLSLRQPWGSAFAEVNFSQYLNTPDKYNVTSFGELSMRLFKGFSVNMFGSISRTRDQIYLPAAGATEEEILVRQRQLLTGYRYFLNFGVSYSFGSIFNNVVNPRFGGGGGDFFF